MNINEKEFDFDSMKAKALEELRSGESLYGKNGAFAPLLKKFLESALEAEMEEHMDESERSRGNRRNGRSNKQIRTSDGTIDIDTCKW
ncbi:transposase [Sphingobacterium multivorum]|uniref:transposase n=1 Tax=Sphingobacterium multivorum TaxID=28454 RepID=UPI00368D26BD